MLVKRCCPSPEGAADARRSRRVLEDRSVVPKPWQQLSRQSKVSTDQGGKTMKAPIIAALTSLASSAPVLAGTFVYVSNAEDGDIGMYTLQADGSLQPGQRFKATKLVMPMAVSPDKRYLIAAVRSKPFQAYSYSIDKSSGALNLVGTGTLAESYPYIALDRSGRFLLGASYGANQVGVNPVGADGRVGAPGDPDGTQCAFHPHRQHEPLCVRAAPWHRPGVPVPLRRKERTALREHTAGPPAQARYRAASPDRFARQPLRLSAQRADRHGHHAVAGPERRDAQGTRLRVCVAPGHQARHRCAAWSRRDARREPGPAEHRQRYLGVGSSPHARRPLSLRRGAHIEHARRLPRRYRERKAHLSRKHADREAAPRFQYRPDRPLRSRLRRAVGHDLFLRDRRRNRRAEADRTLPDRQRRELGRNRRLRLKP